MKKLFATLLLMLLALFCLPALAETQVVTLPDQSVTLRVYGSTAVERTPGTVIRSFTSDRVVAYTSPAGIVSGDRSGSTTAVLKEYDGEKDILYVTNVNVTVLPLDKTVDYKWDQSANSSALQQYVKLNGYIFPVGMKYSFRMVYTVDGVEVPVTYSSSNPAVASIDKNGMVTMKSAGTATLSAYCDGKQTGTTLPLSVYSSNTGGGMWGYYKPEDPGVPTKVYAKPDKSSKVLYTIQRDHVLDNGTADLVLHTLEKGEEWCKVTCQLGTGYIPTSELRFPSNKMYDAPALKEGEQVAEQPADTAFRTYSVGGTVYANTGEPDLYAKPDKASTKLLTIPVNDPMTVLGEEGSFLKVKYQGKTGYITLHSVSSRPAEATNKRELNLPATMYVCALLDMPLFSQPSARGYSAEYPSGTAVWALEKCNEQWVKVQVDGKTGYMLLDYLTSVKPSQSSEAQLTTASQMIIRTGNDGKLNLRAEKSTSSRSIARYPNGTQVAVLEQSGEWVKVKVGNHTGYMMAKFLVSPAAQPSQQPTAPEATEPQAAPSGTKTVTTGNDGKLNLRDQPRSGARILGKFPNGTQVTVLDAMDATWDMVRIGGQTGYMMDKFLAGSATTVQPPQQAEQAPQPENTTPTVTVNKTMVIKTGNDGKLNLRSEKSTSSRSIERYPNGTQVTVLEQSGAWVKVQIGNRTGYMMVKFLAAPGAATPPVESKPQQPAAQPEASTPAASTPVTSSRTVTHPNGTFVNLRSGAGTDYKPLCKVPHGATVTLLSHGHYWSKVSYQGTEGYMATRYLVP